MWHIVIDYLMEGAWKDHWHKMTMGNLFMGFVCDVDAICMLLCLYTEIWCQSEMNERNETRR